MRTVLVCPHAADGETEALQLCGMLESRIPGIHARSVGLGSDFSPTAILTMSPSEVVVICVIGKHWLPGAQPDGPLDQLLAFALSELMPVIPVLVQGAALPAAAELPEPLRSLALCAPLSLSETPSADEFDRLAAAVGQYLYPPQAAAPAPSAAPDTVFCPREEKVVYRKVRLGLLSRVGAAVERIVEAFKSRPVEPDMAAPPPSPEPSAPRVPEPTVAIDAGESPPASPETTFMPELEAEASEPPMAAEPGAPEPDSNIAACECPPSSSEARLRPKAGAGASEPVPVLLGVSAPRGVKPGAVFTARFAAYVKALEAAVGRKLEELGRGRNETLLGAGTCRWVNGTVVTVRLGGESFIAQPAEASFTWSGEQNIVSFAVKTAPDAPEGWTVLCFEVYLAGVQVALVPLDIEVASSPAASAETTSTASPARTAFASYASPDRARVLDKVSAVCACDRGLEVFTDCLDLRPGEEWQRRLEQEIPRRDLFLLFWSVNALKSSWVDWEWRKALATKGPSAIQPVPLDSPDVAPPPRELSHLHFNDRYLQLRNAALASASLRPQPAAPDGD